MYNIIERHNFSYITFVSVKSGPKIQTILITPNYCTHFEDLFREKVYEAQRFPQYFYNKFVWVMVGFVILV